MQLPGIASTAAVSSAGLKGSPAAAPPGGREGADFLSIFLSEALGAPPAPDGRALLAMTAGPDEPDHKALPEGAGDPEARDDSDAGAALPAPDGPGSEDAEAPHHWPDAPRLADEEMDPAPWQHPAGALAGPGPVDRDGDSLRTSESPGEQPWMTDSAEGQVLSRPALDAFIGPAARRFAVADPAKTEAVPMATVGPEISTPPHAATVVGGASWAMRSPAHPADVAMATRPARSQGAGLSATAQGPDKGDDRRDRAGGIGPAAAILDRASPLPALASPEGPSSAAADRAEVGKSLMQDHPDTPARGLTATAAEPPTPAGASLPGLADGTERSTSGPADVSRAASAPRYDHQSGAEAPARLSAAAGGALVDAHDNALRRGSESDSGGGAASDDPSKPALPQGLNPMARAAQDLTAPGRQQGADWPPAAPDPRQAQVAPSGTPAPRGDPPVAVRPVQSTSTANAIAWLEEAARHRVPVAGSDPSPAASATGGGLPWARGAGQGRADAVLTDPIRVTPVPHNGRSRGHSPTVATGQPTVASSAARVARHSDATPDPRAAPAPAWFPARQGQGLEPPSRADGAWPWPDGGRAWQAVLVAPGSKGSDGVAPVALPGGGAATPAASVALRQDDGPSVPHASRGTDTLPGPASTTTPATSSAGLPLAPLAIVAASGAAAAGDRPLSDYAPWRDARPAPVAAAAAPAVHGAATAVSTTLRSGRSAVVPVPFAREWRAERPEIRPFEPVGPGHAMGEGRAIQGHATPAQAAPPPGPPAVAVLQQLVQVSGHLGRGPIEVALSPEELGRVRMMMTPGEGGMVLSILADRDETLALLRRNVEMLSADLRDLGFANLSFQFGSGRSGGDPRERDTPPDGRQGAPVPALPSAPTVERMTGLTLPNERLDLRL